MDSCGYVDSHRDINSGGDNYYGYGSLSHPQHEHCHFQNETQDFDKDYYEQRYHRLVLDKEEIERNFEKERRERQSAEEKLQTESRERVLYEQRLSDLNTKLGRYDNDLNLLRNENGFLKSQFDSLRNVINSSVNIESSSFTVSDVPVLQSETSVLLAEHSESYRHEISILANENELFKQIVDIINSQTKERPIEEVSEKYSYESSWKTDADKTRLQDDNSKLKNEVRELRKNQRDLQSQLEELNIDLEEKKRKMKSDVSHIEEKLHSKTIYCQDLERQLLQISSEYQEELQKMELKVESEDLKKTQIQEEVTALENTVHRLELERIEMVAKLDELYNSENEIIIARTELEARFSMEINELQARLEEEVQSKIDLSQEMTLLMNEFSDLRNKSNQMEDMYVGEIQALQMNLSTAISGQGSYPQQPNNNMFLDQMLPQASGAKETESDMQSQLKKEIIKREALERENKDLLYKMKNILSNTDPNAAVTDELLLNHCSTTNDNSRLSGVDSNLRRKVQGLQNKVDELTDECETLRRSARRRKEAENKNRELIDELEELNSERDGMLKKQKALIKEVDNSSSSLQDLSEKNRKLIGEIDAASRKIRDMEDTFRQERNTLIRSFDREKSLEANDYKRKVDGLEDRLRDQKRENQILEEKIRKLDNEIDNLKSINKRSTRDSSNSYLNSSHSSSGASNDSDLKKKIEDLEELLKEKENDHLIHLEGQSKQLRDELEKEKQALKQIFEEEKRKMFANLSSSTVAGSVNSQIAQSGHNMNPDPNSARKPLDTQSNFHSGSEQQYVTLTHVPYATKATTLGSDFPVVQQGAVETPSFQGLQPSHSSVNPQYQSNAYVNQNPMYPPPPMASNNQIAQLNDTINELQKEINRLNSDKQNMEKRLNDLEGQIVRNPGIVIRNESQQQRRKTEGESRVHFELDEVPERDFTKASDRHNDRVDSVEIYSSPDRYDILDSKLQDIMKKLVDEHREHSDELQKQIKLQKDSFEREKGALLNENQKIFTSMKCLKKEIHVLRHEKESLLQKHHKERRESIQREDRTRDELLSVRKEYENKLKLESRRSNEIVQDLQHKIRVYETKVKEMDLKFRKELTLLESRYAQERNQLEIQIKETDNQVKSKMESHYQSKLKTEQEKYEKTLQELRKEIQCLQDQRKEIQNKLSQDASDVGRRVIQSDSFTSNSKNRDHYKRLRFEFENRYAQEKRSFEDTIRDLQREVAELEKEKSDIKSSYKEDREEMEERFEREKRRIEERHRRDMDELKRSLDIFQTNDQMFLTIGGVRSNQF